jgi:hypothetical protein
MSRVRLRYTKQFNSLNAYYLEHIINKSFELLPFSDDLESSDVVILCWPFDCASIKSALDLGCKVIVENLQESNIPDLWELMHYQDRVMILTNGDRDQHRGFFTHSIFEWFWYFESLWYHDRGYDQYRPCRSPSAHRFLMSIGQQRKTRDAVVDALQPVLHDAIWSYMAQGRELPGVPDQHQHDTRWFNPDWYNNTLFSVINETNVEQPAPLFWTEKTSKALAFYHPFVVVSREGLLAKLRHHGFETFPELFDESYDQEPDVWQRIRMATQQVIEFDPDAMRDARVQQKLQHNRDRFFDIDLVQRCIRDKLVNPVKEFVEKRC